MKTEFERCVRPAFAVMGRLGSTRDGDGFIRRLWQEAGARYAEIAPWVKTDEKGLPAGYWGAMSDFSGRFFPWENDFSEGLYLAGAEVRDDAVPPPGWTKWTLPASEYMHTVQKDSGTFARALAWLRQNGLPPVGAVYDFTDPADGHNELYFPVRRL